VLAQTEPSRSTFQTATPPPVTEPAPIITVKPADGGKCADECPALILIEEKDPRHKQCCQKNTKNVTATGELKSYQCSTPEFKPCAPSSPKLLVVATIFSCISCLI